jgi:hypothetical protein
MPSLKKTAEEEVTCEECGSEVTKKCRWCHTYICEKCDNNAKNKCYNPFEKCDFCAGVSHKSCIKRYGYLGDMRVCESCQKKTCGCVAVNKCARCRVHKCGLCGQFNKNEDPRRLLCEKCGEETKKGLLYDKVDVEDGRKDLISEEKAIKKGGSS